MEFGIFFDRHSSEDPVAIGDVSNLLDGANAVNTSPGVYDRKVETQKN